LGGRTVGWVTFFLAVSSPFAINYATSARMYSLMILLSVLAGRSRTRGPDGSSQWARSPPPRCTPTTGGCTSCSSLHCG
jgi:hypothetical protein